MVENDGGKAKSAEKKTNVKEFESQPAQEFLRPKLGGVQKLEW